MAPWVKDLTLSLQLSQIAAVAWVQLLEWELPHAAGMVKIKLHIRKQDIHLCLSALILSK